MYYKSWRIYKKESCGLNMNDSKFVELVYKNVDENSEFRKIDKETDVLSFPMFEKDELDMMVEKGNNEIPETIGDIIISVDRVAEQAKEYGHSFERELAYMVVHGFYHLMGYDHMVEEDKVVMRAKEENVLNMLNIIR